MISNNDYLACLKYFFSDMPIFNNVCKINKNIFVVYVNGNVIIKSNEPLLNNTKMSSCGYSYQISTKEKLIEYLKYIHDNILKRELNTNINELQESSTKVKKDNTDSIKKLQEACVKFDKIINPFNKNNSFFKYRLNEINNSSNVIFNCSYYNDRNVNYKMTDIENKCTVSYELDDKKYSSSFESNIENNTVYIQRNYELGKCDELQLRQFYDGQIYCNLRFNFNNSQLLRNNVYKEANPIVIDLLTEELNNTINYIQYLASQKDKSNKINKI